MASADYLSTGGGKLYIKSIVGGVKQPMVYFGSTDDIKLTSNVTYIEHKNTEQSVSVTDKKVATDRKATITFTSSEISPEMLSRAYMGTKATVTQAAGTAVAQVLTNIAFDTFYDTGIVKITQMVVKDSTDTTTYVEGTDYTYDKNTGYITFLASGGTIVAGDEIHLTIDNDSYDKTLVASLKGEQLEGELIFISDPQAGEKYRYTFKKVDITATGDFALKSADFTTISFEGEALVDDTVTDPTLSDYFAY